MKRITEEQHERLHDLMYYLNGLHALATPDAGNADPSTRIEIERGHMAALLRPAQKIAEDVYYDITENDDRVEFMKISKEEEEPKAREYLNVLLNCKDRKMRRSVISVLGAMAQKYTGDPLPEPEEAAMETGGAE